MRKYILFLALATMAFAACEPDDLRYTDDAGKVAIQATCENPGTKAEIGDDLKFGWTAGDQIAVFAGSGYYDSDPYVSGNQFYFQFEGNTRSNFAVYPASIAVAAHATASDLQVNLPTGYDVTNVSETFSPLPMVAVNNEGENLHFQHLGGLLRLTVNGAPVGATKLVVDLGQKIAGTFEVGSATEDGNTVYYIEAGSGSTPVTFTIPEVTATGTSLVLNVPVPTGTYSSVTLTAKNDADETVGSPVTGTFSWTCARAHGKKLNQVVEEVYEYVFEIVKKGGEGPNVVFPVEGGVLPDDGSTYTVTSYKYSIFEPDVHIPVPWQATFFSEQSQSWRASAPVIVATNPVTGLPTYYRYPAEGWPNAEITEVTTDITFSANSNAESWPTEVVGSASSPRDLSYYDIQGRAQTLRSTANCYTVLGPGYYKIPCVYGNAITGGATNTEAYTGFVRHDGNPIAGPWIQADNGLTIADAVLCWEDSQELVTDVRYDSDYVTFQVGTRSSIATGGNAVIAVRDASGNILWSWHIWCAHSSVVAPTHQVYGNTNLTHAVNPNTMLDVDLGYTGGTSTPRMTRMRFEQRQGNTNVPEEETRVLAQQGSSEIHVMYYQWGRKDPMLWDQASASTWPDQWGGIPWNRDNATSAVFADLVSHPNLWYSKWVLTDDDYNLWNATSSGFGNQDEAVTKTVYDPCPAGWHVPNRNAFTGFTKSGSTGSAGAQDLGNIAYVEGSEGILYQQLPGAWFWTNNGNGNTIFFPSTIHSMGNLYPSGVCLTASASDPEQFTALQYSWLDEDTGAFGHNTIFVNCVFNAGSGCFAVRPVAESGYLAIGEGLRGWE